MVEQCLLANSCRPIAHARAVGEGRLPLAVKLPARVSHKNAADEQALAGAPAL